MSADRNRRFWLDDNGTVRKSIVGASNEAIARELVQRTFSRATAFSHEEVSVMLQIPRKAEALRSTTATGLIRRSAAVAVRLDQPNGASYEGSLAAALRLGPGSSRRAAGSLGLAWRATMAPIAEVHANILLTCGDSPGFRPRYDIHESLRPVDRSAPRAGGRPRQVEAAGGNAIVGRVVADGIIFRRVCRSGRLGLVYGLDTIENLAGVALRLERHSRFADSAGAAPLCKRLGEP